DSPLPIRSPASTRRLRSRSPPTSSAGVRRTAWTRSRSTCGRSIGGRRRKKTGPGVLPCRVPPPPSASAWPLPHTCSGASPPDFREQLYHAGRAMDQAGIKWSILSAFRDDYRQRIASGIKAGARNSLHGGSVRTGGYGNGRAVDVTNADGEAHDVWKWFDANGAKYGLSRPMPGYDPAHIQASGEWRKVAASLRKARIKAAAQARAPVAPEVAKADVVASAPAQANRSD